VYGDDQQVWVLALQAVQVHEHLAHALRIGIRDARDRRFLRGPGDAFLCPRHIADEQRAAFGSEAQEHTE